MRLTLLAVGKLRPFFRSACDEYAGRLARYSEFQEIEIREARRAVSPAAERADESQRLREKVPPGALVVALSRRGALWSSQELASQLDHWRLAARPVALLIGGSHGLDQESLDRADRAWSLGPLTLPHELARVVVLEQLYRAWTILRGEPYHKGVSERAPGGR